MEIKSEGCVREYQLSHADGSKNEYNSSDINIYRNYSYT